MAPPDPALRASGAPPLVRRNPPPPPRRRAESIEAIELDEDDDEPTGGRWITAIALVVIVLGILGLIAMQFLPGEAPSRVANGELPPPAAESARDEPEPPAGADEVAGADEPAAVGADVGEGAPESAQPSSTSASTQAASEPTASEPAVSEPAAAQPTSAEPVVARPAPEPAVEMPSGPVKLGMKHRPLKRGEAGSSDLVSVRLDGPAGATVVLHHGPPGGPYQQLPLRGKSGGRYEEWLNFPPNKGATLEYWIVATHPAASDSASAGSRTSPYRLVLE